MPENSPADTCLQPTVTRGSTAPGKGGQRIAGGSAGGSTLENSNLWIEADAWGDRQYMAQDHEPAVSGAVKPASVSFHFSK